MRRAIYVAGIVAIAGLAVAAWFLRPCHDVVDSAKRAGKTAADFPQSASPVFAAMDGGISLSADEVKGRNTWLLWTAGDQDLWDYLAGHSVGTADLLKTIDSRRRASRFQEMGVVNQPGFAQATKSDQYGLWIDVGPQEPDVDPAVYGRPTGIVGLRLYPNPKFDSAAEKNWDASRYYSDPNYYNDPKLVRPYRVGMACGFCHVSFNPLKPPADPENPQWENLSSTIGNQYLKASGIFAPDAGPDSYAYQLFRSWAPGTIDTSFLATDYLNDPSNMNPIYALPARLSVAHEEAISGGALNFPGEKNPMAVPHVLKDGADSVGVIGALARVYVSIGEYSEEWLRDHNAIIGGTPQRPFPVAQAQKNSVYWQSTMERLPNLAAFLSKMNGPRLADAPGGQSYLTADEKLLQRGKIVFAENCARCHSSKQPPDIKDRKSPEYLAWSRQEVLKPDFLDNNFLSTEDRIPISAIQTNATRALATNAMRGHVWDNFSSETYKTLPASGEIEVLNPFTNAVTKFQPPAGGPGYYRVPSLIAIWATAPFLHNNQLGEYTGDPSVAGRMKAFDDAMQKLLWPERRLGAASIARTTAESYIQIPALTVPGPLQSLAKDGYLRIGPIPAGTPIDLLANADFDPSDQGLAAERAKLAAEVQADLLQIRVRHLNAEESRRLLTTLAPALLRISKSPDFVLDRGHYFGSKLSDADKQALIEFVKTF